jgi:bifunctional ADP-heptose synthase (sugar kinase/adenylyltransferase)
MALISFSSPILVKGGDWTRKRRLEGSRQQCGGELVILPFIGVFHLNLIESLKPL